MKHIGSVVALAVIGAGQAMSWREIAEYSLRMYGLIIGAVIATVTLYGILKGKKKKR